jgi:glycine betaine transporter
LSHKINYPVFLIPLVILLSTLVLSLWFGIGFTAIEKQANDWILFHFGWLFAGAGLSFLLLLLTVALSPLGKSIIGGPDAQPLLGRWRWFAVTLCTTIATGILFWGVAEPLFHLNAPPAMLGLTPGSDAAATFAMSTMFLHWTLTPYAIYTVAALAFALVYYNRHEPFSLSSLFTPLIGRRAHGLFGTGIDIICLFALVAGMAAALGAGIIALSGGIEGMTGFQGGATLKWAIAAAIVGTFILSAASGLQRGIARLSVINLWLFIGLILFILITGPMVQALSLGERGLTDYAATFFQRNLAVGTDPDWSRNWTITYWSNWFAWAPVTALFLGRLAVGYSVRDFILYNLLLPSLFGAIWMVAIAGTTIIIDQNGGGLYAMLVSDGPDPLLYQLFSALRGGPTALLFLIVAIFLSYVTAADSNVSAMSALSTHGISPDSPEAPLLVKLIWGITVGLTATLLVASSGLEGIRMMSVLGGFPALFVIIGAGVSLLVMTVRGPSSRTAPLPK